MIATNEVRAPVSRPADGSDGSPLPARHFLTLAGIGPQGLRRLLDLAERARRNPALFERAAAGGRVGLLFEQPSTRTRVSLEVAAWQLGMLPIALRADELQLGRGETIADTARVLSGYLSVLAVRTRAQATVDELARSASIPIVNALTELHHPCQALADLLTMEQEWGTLAGARVAYLGDGNNVCHSLIEGAALGGFTLRVATPRGDEPDARIVEAARRIGRETGAEIEVMNDARSALDGVDAVYTDVWTSMGHDAERAARRERFCAYRVDEAAMARAASHAIFLHCLPAHRGEEVSDAVIDGPRSRVWEQAENRLHTEIALLYALASGDADGRHLEARSGAAGRFESGPSDGGPEHGGFEEGGQIAGGTAGTGRVTDSR